MAAARGSNYISHHNQLPYHSYSIGSVTESMKKRLVHSDSCRLYSNILSADHSSQFISYDYYIYEGLAVTEKSLSDLHALCGLNIG